MNPITTEPVNAASHTKLPNVEDIYPLSPMQQGMLFHSLYEPESGVYFFQVGFKLDGRLNSEAFRRAWEELVRRHSVLRTGFLWEGLDEAVQVVRRKVELPWREEDWRVFDKVEREKLWSRFLEEDRQRGFDLKRAPLFRLTLIRVDEESYYFAYSIHHLLVDGWCQDIMTREVFQMYEAFRTGRELRLPPTRPYREYIGWLQKQDEQKAEAFWRQELQGFTHAIRLGIERERVEEGARGAQDQSEITVFMGRDATAKVDALARSLQVTLNTLVQGAWAFLLSRYSGETDVLFGAAVSGRSASVRGIESMLGLFFNTLPVRLRINGADTIASYMKALQSKQAVIRDFEYSPLLKVQKWSDVPRGKPLFEYMVVFANYAKNTAPAERSGASLEVGVLTSFEINNYPLTLTVGPGDDLSFRYNFNRKSFDAVSMERMLRHLCTLLGRMAGDAGQRLSELELLTEEERREVVGEWNQTGEDYGEAVCLQELFEEQAERTPEEAAVVWEGKGMSYGELEKRSNQLGHYLRKQGVGPEVRVGLCVGRSPEMVVGLLGILKAGGAYVALDGSYPKERVAFMVEDAQVSVVLTEARLLEKLPASEEAGEAISRRKPQVVCLDQEWAKIAGERESRPESGVTAENMAYIYYTSGSTGRPKGVVMAHAGIVNYMRWGVEAYEARAGKGAAVHSSIAVDLTLTNFLPLFAGKTMVLVEEKPGVEGLVKLLRQKPGWSLLKLTPTHLTLLNGQLTAEEKRASTRVLVIGADNLVAEPTLAWRKEAPGVKLLNEYGPTETVVGCSIYRIGEGSPRQGGMPIGKPIANMTMYVLDTYGQPLPVGVPGELYIGGIGVARGYWGRAELTAEKFVPDGFGGEAGARFYRTGDRARFLEDGNIEFLGRLDHQVKIRGYRVEPGEVEAVLSGCPGVQKAMVVVREDTPGDKRLVGYVAAPGGGVEVKELRQYLKERLPEYMVPVAWVIMEELPVRGSGKIDPKDLPRPEMEGSQGKGKEEGPRTEVERALAGIWEEVLGVKQVGIHDNFFELGGDSILSIQVITRAREAGLGLQPRQMFERQTIAELAEVVGSESAQVEAEQGLVNGEVELTPIQRAFFEWELVKPEHYNQSVLLEVGRGVDTAVLEEAMVGLLDQHDGLRMRYEEREGEGWRQWCEAEVLESVYERKDLSWIGDEEEQRAELERDAGEVQGSLDIRTGRVVRVVEYELGEERGKRLLLTVHHLVMDGVSWRILLEDLERGYGQRQAGEELSLGMKTTSYQQWAEKLRQYGESDAVRQEMEYWGGEERKRAGRLPRDEEAAGETGEAANLFGMQSGVTVWLEEEETRKLLQEVPGVYQTQINDVLLTALGRVCGEWSGSEAVLVDLEGHGREDIFAEVDISRTVGWFTAMYPVLLEVGEAGQWEPGAALSGTKEQLRGVPRRGIGYGALRYGRGNGSEELRKRLEEMPQAEISFNYLGQIDQILQGSKLFRPGRERIGSESAAENPRQHVLAVSGIVVQGKLQMDWNYSGKLHRRETIAALAERYLDCLRQLIAHCLTPDAGGFTPSDFPLTKLTQNEINQWIRKQDGIEDAYPLSAAQQGMLFHSLFESGTQTYFVQLSCHFAQLNVEAFQRAWNEVIQRHGILRTGFLWDGLEEPVQVVRRMVEQPWHELDARDLGQADQEVKWQKFLIEDRQRGFDLQKAPLLRLTLMRTTENGYYFAWSTHHILLDAWCREILIREVFTFYEAYQQGLATQLKRPPLYRDYIAWLKKQDEKEIETFWRKELKGITTTTRLGIERKRAQTDEWQETVEVILPAGKELTEKLESLARKHQFTLNTLVQGAWGLLLSHYSGERDVIFGMPVSGRSAAISGIEEIAGPFINTLPVRVHVEWEETLSQYLQRLQTRQAEVRDFEHSSLLKVQGWSEIPHGTPLFENIVVFENYPADTALQLKVGAGMNISASSGFMSNHYPLTLTIIPRGELSFMATYERQSFEPGSIERMLGQLRSVLENMAFGLEQKLGHVSLSTQAELLRPVKEWNRTQVPSSSMTVHELFSEQAAKTPQSIAVTWQGVQLTYQELDRRANQLAHYLRNMGIGPEMRVGLCLDRSHELVIALLGVLKSGAAYIPLDPAYPSERLAFMLQDAEIPVLMTSSDLRNGLPTAWAQVLCIDTDWSDISSFPVHKPETCVDGDNLAYVIYTSGSTGKPKGVAVTHRGLANYLQWAIQAYDFKSDIVSPLHSSLSFDLTVTSVYPALLTGGRIVVLPHNAGVSEIAKCLGSGDQCLLKLTPGHLQVLNGLLEKDSFAASNARALVIGGEMLRYADLKFWMLAAPATRLINEYGPTETVVGCCVYEVERNADALGAVPIGRPISNMKMFVLDEMLQPAPVGVKGEVYIGGEGVARGYWRRPDLTAERFVPDPFSETGGGRLYRAGDLARYRDDGIIEYLGRTDHQIKLRGYRIELGEIESMLAAHQAVRQSAVIVREDDQDDQRLVGYVVLNEDSDQPTPDELKDYLRTKLPEYMIPSSLIILEQLPLTANGKLDSKSLPKPGAAVSAAEMAPYDDIATKLEIIWQEVLKVSAIGRHQTFFELGGHSLLAIRLIKRIQEHFGQELPISAVFEAATIEQMSSLLRGDYRPKGRSNLVPLHPHGSRRPLFFVHPGGGGVGGYRDLAQLLGDDQPFYGLQALDDEENKDESILSIEQRAARYIEAIQTVDPDGPYILGGWSMGGFIAYEMAQQLKRQNREIAGLLLVDIVAQTQSDLPSYGDEAEELLEVTREMGTTTFSLESVKEKGIEERLSYLLNQLIEAKVLAPEITVPLVRSFLKGLRRRNQSMIDYKLSPYSGPVTLIRAEQGRTTISPKINSADPTLGFSGLCSKVQVAFVPGTHYDLMFPPHVERLAEEVKNSLQDFGLCQEEASLQKGFVAV
jgi:amino acid adenylation domain-containing protein/non-ribosomal peptide synthase protein (TIGR01720 family)